MALDVAWAVDWARESARTVVEHRDELVELDRQIETLRRFKEVAPK